MKWGQNTRPMHRAEKVSLPSLSSGHPVCLLATFKISPRRQIYSAVISNGDLGTILIKRYLVFTKKFAGHTAFVKKRSRNRHRYLLFRAFPEKWSLSENDENTKKAIIVWWSWQSNLSMAVPTSAFLI